MILLHVTYHLLKENAGEYAQVLEQSGLPAVFRGEQGNIRYDYFLSAARPDQLLLIEEWESEEALHRHMQTEHFRQLTGYKEAFVKETEIQKFYVSRQ